eukprot:121441-Prymnesium_polylepis.1
MSNGTLPSAPLANPSSAINVRRNRAAAARSCIPPRVVCAFIRAWRVARGVTAWKVRDGTRRNKKGGVPSPHGA